MKMIGNHHRLRGLLRISLLGLAVALVGCGGRSDIADVSGTITLGEQPLANARVVFQPQDGGVPSYGLTDASGNYELQYNQEITGAMIGRHTVSISTFMTGDPDADPPQTNSPERVPVKYNASSELTAEVVPGSNTFDFKLEEGEPTDWQRVGLSPADSR